MDQLILHEKSKSQELQLETSQGISLVLELLKTPKTDTEEGEWIDIVLKRLKASETEDGLELKAKTQGVSKQITKGPKIVDSLYTSSEIKYEKILENELQRIQKTNLILHKSSVYSVCASLDGKFIVSGSDDYSIKVWNLFESKEECTFIGHTGTVKSVCVSPDSKLIVSGSDDKSIKSLEYFRTQRRVHFHRTYRKCVVSMH